MESKPKRFFGIRGYMKSGTNWVGNLLRQHPDVSVVGEFHWEEFIRQSYRIQQEHFLKNRNFDGWFRESVDELIRQTLIKGNAPNASVVGDRTPITLQPFLLPEAKYINVIRDGRDVLVSRLFHLYNNPSVTTVFDQSPEMAAYLKQFQSDRWFFHKNPELLFVFESLVEDSIHNWVSHLEQDQQTLRDHPQLPVLEVQYEHLHQDLDRHLAQMFEFLEVDPKACPELPENVRPGIQKETPNSLYRKGEVGGWKMYFSDPLQQKFTDIAGEQLQRLGYEV